MVEDPIHLEPEQFDELVSGVMDELPADWGPILDNMAVVIEDEPGEEDVPEGASAEALLGRYRRTTQPIQFIGGGLTAPTVGVPPEIALFQGPLERASSSLEDLRAHVRATLIQEIGRHLGVRQADDAMDAWDGDEENGEDDEEDGEP